MLQINERLQFGLAMALAISILPPDSGAHAQPGKAAVDAAMKRTFGYDPQVSWDILEVRPAKISGLTEVLVNVNGHLTKLYLSADERDALVGDIIPFGLDPFAPARAQLRTVEGPSRNAGPVDLVIFSDFECSRCKAAQAVLDKLATDFPRVRQVFVQMPLTGKEHPWAHQAALWADCAGAADGKAFWPFADAAFAGQEKITSENLDETLGSLAEQQGLSRSAVGKCVTSPLAAARVQASAAIGAKLEVTQIPTVFLNGRRVTEITSIPYENLKQLVRFEIDQAGH